MTKVGMISKENNYRCDPEGKENRKPRRNKSSEFQTRMGLTLAGRRIWFRIKLTSLEGYC